ncbi:hypothetical protein SK128_004525 [Halocaridina rubra]|uniref:Uncharacterized protein n=1 Tax=Halocaridina rubra TaxID=373956 RepID=A0AAN8XHY8_HALRR
MRHSDQRKRNVSFSYKCTGEHNINVGEELAKLQPSQRLLDYYREKITKFENEYQHMKILIEKCEQVNKPTFLEDERRQMVRELVELRSALSDVNIFIHAERQQVMRLHSEKERLNLDVLEAEKKIALLLSLSGLTEGELKVFLRDPKRISLIKQKLPPNLKKLQEKLTDSFPESGNNENELMLAAHVKSLERQVQQAESSWLEEKSAILQERTLTAAEVKLHLEKDEAQINLLASRLQETQLHLNNATKQTLSKTAEVEELEKKWLAERDHLLSVLATVQDNLPFVSHMEAVQRSGSYTDLTKIKSTCELKDLRRENEILKREFSDAEELRAMYESQCLKLEQTMCKLREQKEASELLYKERNQKLHQQIESLQRDKRRVDERRKFDLKGFQSDIQLIRNDVKTLVAQIYKITMVMYGDSHHPVNLEALNEMQAVSALVRRVQKVLGDTRRKMLSVETEISNEPS